MRSATRRPARRPLATPALRLVVATLAVGSLAGCATVAEAVLQTVVDEVADSDAPRSPAPTAGDAPADPSDAGPMLAARERHGAPQSVYVEGPVPGWQRGLASLRFSSSPYFTARLFRGQCPALFTLRLGRGSDPFGPVERAPVGAFDMGNNLGISPDYVRFGRVELGGMGPQHYQWQPMSLFHGAGDGCGPAGLRLLSFGEQRVDVLHR